MRRTLFWIITSTIFGLMAHVTYTLFAPAQGFGRAITTAMESPVANSFVVLNPARHMKLIPFASENHVVGLCRIDVSKGPVKLSARLPEGFWTFAVYTLRGQQLYAINDTQADTDSFDVEFTSGGSVLDQLFNAQEIDFAGDDLGWRVTMAEKEGLAVLWLAVADPLLRAEAEAQMRKSKCRRSDG